MISRVAPIPGVCAEHEWKVAPRLELFSAQSRPPCAVTIDRLTARPRPSPLSFVV